jgi:hypothetical protein
MNTNTLELEKSSAIITNNTTELSKHYEMFIQKLVQFVEDRQYLEGTQSKYVYQLKGAINDSIDPSVITKAGIKNIRRFKRYLNRANRYMSTLSINKFLHLVYKRILKSELPIPYIVSEKHEKIQKLRKEWKKQQEIADALHQQYLSEKSLFYKIQ